MIYTRDAKDLFNAISKLPDEAKWIFILDEGGLMYSKADATTRRAKDLDKFVRIIGKLHGSMIIIEQREESVPTILQEFATSLYFCERPGVVNIELKGPELAFRGTVSKFPKTTLPFQTYDIAYFSLNINLIAMFVALSGEGDVKQALRNFMSGAMKQVATKVCGNPDCGKELIGMHPAAKYCSHACLQRVWATKKRLEQDEKGQDYEEQTPQEVLTSGEETTGTPSPFVFPKRKP